MKTKLLKALRQEANANIDFQGRWMGRWFTKIRGVGYMSHEVTGLQYVLGHFDRFVDMAILHRVRYLKLKRMPGEEEYYDSIIYGKHIEIRYGK